MGETMKTEQKENTGTFVEEENNSDNSGIEAESIHNQPMEKEQAVRDSQAVCDGQDTKTEDLDKTAEADFYENVIKNYKGKEAEHDDIHDKISEFKDNINNLGAMFENSKFNNVTFNFGNGADQRNKSIHSLSWSVPMDEEKLIAWQKEHYKDKYFCFLISACMLNEQPLNTVIEFADNLETAFSDTLSEDRKKEAMEPVSMHELIEELGLIEYKDYVSTFGCEFETSYLRVPVPKSAFEVFRILISNYPEINRILSEKLIEIVYTMLRPNPDYILGNMALRTIAWLVIINNIQTFNEGILKKLTAKKDPLMDYLVAVILYQVYEIDEYKRYVAEIVRNWGKVANNVHYPLIALHVCTLVKNQEQAVQNIMNTVIKQMEKELKEDDKKSFMYVKYWEIFIDSGERFLSFNKGTIKALYMELLSVEETRDREKKRSFAFILWLYFMNDYSKIRIRDINNPNYKDMILISIFAKLSENERNQLASLWAYVLENPIFSKDTWGKMDNYLSMYSQCQSKKELKKLCMFFYYLNYNCQSKKVTRFLYNCFSRTNNKNYIAEYIYDFITKEE